MTNLCIQCWQVDDSICPRGIARSHIGSVIFEDGGAQPPRGALGIVPQKNVLFPELTCLQTLRVWQAMKYSDAALGGNEDLQQLLLDCDLTGKAGTNAQTLFGGQKRKPQLAIGLVGGSKSMFSSWSCARNMLMSFSRARGRVHVRRRPSLASSSLAYVDERSSRAYSDLHYTRT